MRLQVGQGKRSCSLKRALCVAGDCAGQEKDLRLHAVPPLERGVKMPSISPSWWSAELLQEVRVEVRPSTLCSRRRSALPTASGTCVLLSSPAAPSSAQSLHLPRCGSGRNSGAGSAAPHPGGDSPTRAKCSIAVMFESSLKNYFFIQFLPKQVEAPQTQQFLPVLLPNQCSLACG